MKYHLQKILIKNLMSRLAGNGRYGETPFLLYQNAICRQWMEAKIVLIPANAKVIARQKKGQK
jgi:hypothetical protein